MMFGNISNNSAPIVAFNLDNLIYEPEADTTSMFGFIFLGRFARKPKVNENFIDILNNVWINHDLAIYLVTTNNDVREYERILDNHHALYTRIQHYAGIDTLKRLVEYRYHYYVDNDRNMLNQIGNKAVHIDDLHKYLKTGGRV